jgi:hypothetical protein
METAFKVALAQLDENLKEAEEAKEPIA